MKPGALEREKGAAGWLRELGEGGQDSNEVRQHAGSFRRPANIIPLKSMKHARSRKRAAHCRHVVRAARSAFGGLMADLPVLPSTLPFRSSSQPHSCTWRGSKGNI